MNARAVGAAALLLLAARAAAGDIVTLHGGRRIYGTVEEREGKVTVRTGGGSSVTIPRDQVLKIEKESPFQFCVREGKERLAADDLVAARDLLEKALSMDPEGDAAKGPLAACYVGLARQDLEEYRLAAVVKNARAALAVEPGNEEAGRLLAEAERTLRAGAPEEAPTVSEAAFLRAQAEAAARVQRATGGARDLERAERLFRGAGERLAAIRRGLEREIRALTPRERTPAGPIFRSDLDRESWIDRKRKLRGIDAQAAWTEALWARLFPPGSPSREAHVRRARDALEESARGNPSEARTPRHLLAAALAAAASGDAKRAGGLFDEAARAIGSARAPAYLDLLRGIQLYRAESLLEAGDPAGARRALSEIRQLSESGAGFAREADLLEVQALLASARAAAPKDPKGAQAGLAEAARIVERFRAPGASPSERARAEALLARIAEVAEGRSLPDTAAREKAAALLSERRYGEAIPILRALVEGTGLSADEREEAAFCLGLCELKGGRTDEGVRRLDRFAGEFPGSARRAEAAFLALVGAELLLPRGDAPPGDLAKVSERFRSYVERFPGHALREEATRDFLALGPERAGAAAAPALLAIPEGSAGRAEARLRAGLVLAAGAARVDPARSPEETRRRKEEAASALAEALAAERAAGPGPRPFPEAQGDEAILVVASLRLDLGEAEGGREALASAAARPLDPAGAARRSVLGFRAAAAGAAPDFAAARKALEALPRDRRGWPPGAAADLLSALSAALSRDLGAAAREAGVALRQDLVKALLGRALDDKDATFEDLAGMAAWASSEGDLELAARIWERLVGRFRDDPLRGLEIRTAKARLARTLLALGRLPEAERALAEIAKDGSDPEASIVRARVLERLGRTAEAWKVLEGLDKAVAQGSPLWFEKRLVAVRCRMRDRDWDGSLKALRLTAAYYPDLGGAASRAEFAALARELLGALPPDRRAEGEGVVRAVEKGGP